MKNKYLSFLILFLTVCLTSCLKDDKYALDPSGGHNVIEFYNVTAPTTGYNDSNLVYQPKTFEADEVEGEFTIGINFAGPENVAPSDIIVGLALNPAATTKAGYTQLDPSLYNAIPSTVTIKKGEKKVLFTVKVKPSQFNLALRNAIGLSIVSTNYAVISGNVGTAVFSLPVKNDYDGIYKIQSGFVQRYSNPTTPTTGDALNGSLAGNPNLTLTTIDATTSQISNLRWAGGTSTVSGIDNLRVKVDPVTNLVTMLSLGNATLVNRPGFENKYDPATRTFTLNFHWNLTSTKREINLVIKWDKDR